MAHEICSAVPWYLLSFHFLDQSSLKNSQLCWAPQRKRISFYFHSFSLFYFIYALVNIASFLSFFSLLFLFGFLNWKLIFNSSLFFSNMSILVLNLLLNCNLHILISCLYLTQFEIPPHSHLYFFFHLELFRKLLSIKYLEISDMFLLMLFNLSPL